MTDTWPAWRPVEDAPKDGTHLLLFGSGPGFQDCSVIGYFGRRPGYDDDVPSWREIGHGWRIGPPIAWLPLPPPPVS